MKVSITSGRAEGPTKLNAFDNALLDAKIGDVNLIKVSSILPSGYGGSSCSKISSRGHG